MLAHTHGWCFVFDVDAIQNARTHARTHARAALQVGTHCVGTGSEAGVNHLRSQCRQHKDDQPTCTAASEVCVWLPTGDTQVFATLRDFNLDHPDFNTFLGAEKGCVKKLLSKDNKPLPTEACNKFTNKANFNQWYGKETPAVTRPLLFKHNPETGLYVYDNSMYFPLTGLGCKDDVWGYNFFFTTELALVFTYALPL